jgi:hypothetical protein
MRFFKVFLKHTLGMLVALWVLAEDAFWGVFERITAWMSRWAWLKSLEAFLSKCPPYLALGLFLIPGLILLPFKVLGLWLMGHHQYALGVSTFILAKVVGTALGARLFVVLKPTLMTLSWFASGLTRFLSWKAAVVAFAKTSYTYRLLQLVKRKLKRTKEKWLLIWKIR